MQGSVAKCVQHFFEAVPVNEAAELLAEFIGVQPVTALEWRQGMRLPRGEGDVRLRIFLEAAGYQLDELQGLPSPTMTVARALGFRLVAIDDVMTTLGYANTHGIFRLLLQRGNPDKTRAYRLKKLADESAEDVAVAQEMWQERLEPIRRLLAGTPDPAAAEPDGIRRPLAAPVPDTPVSRETVRQPPAADRSVPDYDPRTSRVVMHLILALEEILESKVSHELLAQLVKERVSSKRLRTLQDFLEQVQQS